MKHTFTIAPTDISLQYKNQRFQHRQYQTTPLDTIVVQYTVHSPKTYLNVTYTSPFQSPKAKLSKMFPRQNYVCIHFSPPFYPSYTSNQSHSPRFHITTILSGLYQSRNSSLRNILSPFSPIHIISEHSLCTYLSKDL
jgi:hypothetical protein